MIRKLVHVFTLMAVVSASLASGTSVPRRDRLLGEVEQLFQQQRYVDAIGVVERALADAERDLGPEHRDVGRMLAVLAGLRQFVVTAPLLERSVAILEKALGPEHPDLAKVLIDLASAYEKVGRWDESQALRHRAEEIKAQAHDS